MLLNEKNWLFSLNFYFFNSLYEIIQILISNLFLIFRFFTGPEKFHHQRRIISQYHPLAQCRSPCQPITKCWYHSHLHYLATVHPRAFYRSMDLIDSMNRRVSAGLLLSSRPLQPDGSLRKISSLRCTKHIYKALLRTSQQPSPNRNDHASSSDRNTKPQVTAAKTATMERKSPNWRNEWFLLTTKALNSNTWK